MGAAAAEADRTLFVGNLDPKVTEELLFELFHQAGPVIKVKIPKDKDGKAKQFAFVNFKHEESVPYGMSLLNGIKLFGRPLKIQFRSGSSHASQDSGSPYPPQISPNGSLSGVQQLPAATASNWYERSTDNVPAVQRSFSSPDNLQRQAVMNNVMWQQSQYGGRHGSPHPDPSGFASPGHQPSYSFPQSPAPSMPWRSEAVVSQRKSRVSSHPYPSEGRHYGREQQPRVGDYGSEYHFRGSRDEYCHNDRNYGDWSHDYDHRRETYRDGKWRPSRH
ncbi:hypothetical protein JD844_031608 [Phrynosoma platyrhinos]|uniref:RRM domain-containing protein n=1 Tax=Phrynosoma platyrhinos TaxID=52577 RepID=A0ABQ7T1I2_PHRPL|nr:hypothetical protein JD844_031608 [Phrynosoma platyrhinos]